MKVQFLVVMIFSLTTAVHAEPNLVGKTDRPLRYHPDGTDFVIENGPERFNRPLYIRNSAMRVDAGDRPEFSLFLPGRGGNFRMGVRVAKRSMWLDEAQNIVARYRPGEMLYEIRDPMLGDGAINVHLLTLADTDGYVVRIEPHGLPEGVEAIFAFGGANGDKGKRNGDIGCENVPVSEFFALKPAYCAGNQYTLHDDHFFLESKAGKLVGIVPAQTTLKLGAAAKWDRLDELLESTGAGSDEPVVVGWTAIGNSASLGYIVQKQSDEANAGVAFDRAAARAKALREQVVVDTPDPFINVAAAALNVAADGVWDEKLGTVMHGAVAWRVKLLGWRGPYANDALGWHDRAERHLRYWGEQQNEGSGVRVQGSGNVDADAPTSAPATSSLNPEPRTLNPSPADPEANLSRSEHLLHSEGDISHSHYDMNLVYIDALFRHLMWTGDLKMAPICGR